VLSDPIAAARGEGLGDVALPLEPAFGDPERLVATTYLVRNGHPRRRRHNRRPCFGIAG
jgi:hypothetical protein